MKFERGSESGNNRYVRIPRDANYTGAGGEHLALDISDGVMGIIDGPDDENYPKQLKLLEFLKTYKSEPAITIRCEWRGADWAMWAKGFLEDYGAMKDKQKRSVFIECTKQQMMTASNAFASGVNWIKRE